MTTMVVYKAVHLIYYTSFNKASYECSLFFETVSKVLQLRQKLKMKSEEMFLFDIDTELTSAGTAFSNRHEGTVSPMRMWRHRRQTAKPCERRSLTCRWLKKRLIILWMWKITNRLMEKMNNSMMIILLRRLVTFFTGSLYCTCLCKRFGS